MVGPGRFELPTSPLSGVRSNQLSYGPDTSDPGLAEVVVISSEERETWAAMPAITTTVQRPASLFVHARPQPDWPRP